MKRYDMEYDWCSQITSMELAEDGDYVLHSEAQAEIERLRNALRKRAAEAGDADYRAHTAHNDAIEAAAIHLEEWGDIYGDNAAAAIRATQTPIMKRIKTSAYGFVLFGYMTYISGQAFPPWGQALYIAFIAGVMLLLPND